jgi:hypothetical protein
MSDPIAQAAAQIDAAPSSTEPSILTEIVGEFKALGEKVEHLIHPEPVQEGGAAAAGESSSASQPAAIEPKVSQESMTLTDGGASDAGSNTSNSSISEDGSTEQELGDEHPHTGILRRLTETLRRKFNVFDGELEALLKDAESHL